MKVSEDEETGSERHAPTNTAVLLPPVHRRWRCGGGHPHMSPALHTCARQLAFHHFVYMNRHLYICVDRACNLLQRTVCIFCTTLALLPVDRSVGNFVHVSLLRNADGHTHEAYVNRAGFSVHCKGVSNVEIRGVIRMLRSTIR
jgi:hypothetical protein